MDRFELVKRNTEELVSEEEIREICTRYVSGTEFQLGSEYTLNMLKLSRTTTRARRSMDEVSRDAENPYVSQMIYPLMQAVDIAMLKVDVAVGGIDQRKIHMLARDTLPSIGFKNNPILELFKYHIEPRYGKLIIERPEKFGGDIKYENYTALENDFAEKKIHPQDLKTSAAEHLINIFKPVRETMKETTQ
ncbi:hypothetical protein B6U67_03180 [Methanosarcinales archaeon ex4484_138]|nr:MAG: hypothetical protein B6U67_03180 [Methanosarcinales archaeon ex4484_138]